MQETNLLLRMITKEHHFGEKIERKKEVSDNSVEILSEEVD